MQHEARAFQAASAALRACMKALKESYPKQAADLAIAALTVLTEVSSQALLYFQHTEKCLSWWSCL